MNAVDIKQKFPDINPDLIRVALELQALVLDIYPDFVISEDDQNIGYGYGSGYKDLVFVISPHKAHVTLGIANGAALKDPYNLLEGKGKVHRHIKIMQAEQLRDPNLISLLTDAVHSTQENRTTEN